MPGTLNPVARFALRAVLALPFAFLLWYWATAWLAVPAAWLSTLILKGLYPALLAGIQQNGHELILATTARAARRLADGTIGYPQLTFSIDTLSYTSGRALFLALMLAGPTRRPLLHFALGMLALVLVESWGICFRFLAEVAGITGPAIGVIRWHLIAAGHHLGSLLFPTLAPIALWGAWYFDVERRRSLLGRRDGGVEPPRST